MRNSFIKAMEEFVTPNVILFLGDLGFGVVDKFRQKYPNQLWNAGVAEQNLTGLATGLALSGKKVFTYSIANFNTLRPLEQIRNDIAYHNLNVVIVSVGGGMAYGSLGISHHATEDLAILRAIPNMMVLAPGDTKEAYEITKRLIQDDYGPVYLRLGRAGEATLHKDDISQKLEIGKLLPLVKSDEKKLAIISTGGMLETANKLNGLLHEINVTSSVYSMHTLKPSDKSAIVRIFNDYEKVISLEEHSIIGGLQSAILESLVGVSGIKLEKFTPFALPSVFTSIVGDQEYLRDYYGLSEQKILEKLKSILKT